MNLIFFIIFLFILLIWYILSNETKLKSENVESQRLNIRDDINEEDNVKRIRSLDDQNDSNIVCSFNDGSKVYHKIRNAVVMISVDSRWQGTGFFISPDGYICTAAHVITSSKEKSAGLEPAKNIYVLVCPSYEVYKCKIIGYDGAGDIGVLKIDENDPYNQSLPPIRNQQHLQFEPQAKTGELAFVLGYPLGTDISSFSMGIVRNEKFVAPSLFIPFNLILITCPAYQGNSGSPIVNASGKVIGLLTFVYFSKEQTYESIGGGPCSDIVKYVTDQVMDGYKSKGNPHFDYETKKYKKGFFGMGPCRMVWFSDIPNLKDKYRFPRTRPIGFRGQGYQDKAFGIKKTNDSNDAKQLITSPFKPTDVITAINGVDIGALPEQFAPGTILWKTIPNQEIRVDYYSLDDNGSYSTLKQKIVKLVEYPDPLDSFEGRALKVEITCSDDSCSLISGIFDIPEPSTPVGF